MSLPTDPKTPWPPPDAAPKDIAVWRAFYAGDEPQAKAAAGPAAPRFRRVFSRKWRAEPVELPRPRDISACLAGEIAQASADLLFGDAPDFGFAEGSKAAQRLDELLEESGGINALLEAAEVCAALGGGYIRASWDTEVSDTPFLTALYPDEAVPEFAYGRYLRAVTFFHELPSDRKDRVVRHLERHEKGVILHGLYLGDSATLGEQMPLAARPETEKLDEAVELPDALVRDVWYVPNVKPLRSAPHSPHGRADIQGAESFLAALDLTYSSLLRDIDLGKARILVPSEALKPAERGGGRGSGKTFDLDEEIFTELDGMDPESGVGITTYQPDIRTQAHIDAALTWIERVISAAGYSPQTFGLRIEGRAESGTALRIREGKTAKTIARKQRYWAPTLAAASEALLVIDRDVFGRPTEVRRPTIAWPEEQQTQAELADTLELLRRAEAISIETAVRRAQPELDEEKLAAEVERIRQENGSLVPEPAF